MRVQVFVCVCVCVQVFFCVCVCVRTCIVFLTDVLTGELRELHY